MKSPSDVRDQATKRVIDLEDGRLLYGVIQEHAILARSAERESDQDGQPRGIGGISDPTGGEAMREVCNRCDGTMKRRNRIECPVCEGRCSIVDMGSGEPIPCPRCEGKGKINTYGPDPCTHCDQGWTFTEAQLLERQCDAFVAALDAIGRTVSAMRRSAPQFANGLIEIREAIEEAKKNKGKKKGAAPKKDERFPVQEEGAVCVACGIRVPKLREQLCVAYAIDPQRRDPATNKFLTNPAMPGCYDKWLLAFAAEDVSRKEWIAREKELRASAVRDPRPAESIVDATKREPKLPGHRIRVEAP